MTVLPCSSRAPAADAPFAYNKGIEDTQAFFTARTADLPGVCFEETLTYWEKKPGAARTVRRKPER